MGCLCCNYQCWWSIELNNGWVSLLDKLRSETIGGGSDFESRIVWCHIDFSTHTYLIFQNFIFKNYILAPPPLFQHQRCTPRLSTTDSPDLWSSPRYPLVFPTTTIILWYSSTNGAPPISPHTPRLAPRYTT